MTEPRNHKCTICGFLTNDWLEMSSHNCHVFKEPNAGYATPISTLGKLEPADFMLSSLGLKWEYHILPIEGERDHWQFNELGRQGWELVTVTAGTADYNPVAYFKRLLIK